MPESEWRAPCYKGRRNACRRKRAAAAAAAAERWWRSDDKTSERSEPETMQVGVTPLGRTGTAATKTWREWVYGKGKRRSAAYKSRKRNRRRH